MIAPLAIITTERLKRNVMPNFNTLPLSINKDIDGKLEKIAEFQIKANPLGIRGIKGLSWLLRRLPYVTGSKPKFRFQVKRVYQKRPGDYFNVLLYRSAHGKETILDLGNKTYEDCYTRSFEDSVIVEPGVYTYNIVVQTRLETAKATIVDFRALAQEDVFMALFSAVVDSFVRWLLMTLTWLFMTLK